MAFGEMEPTGMRRSSAESQEDWEDKISEYINTYGLEAVEDAIERNRKNRAGGSASPEAIH